MNKQYTDNIRLLIDKTNLTEQIDYTSIRVDNSQTIVKRVGLYEVSVEKLELPTANLPMNSADVSLKIGLWVERDPIPALLKKELTVFELPRIYYYNPDEIINEINALINKYTYDYPIGNIKYDYDLSRFYFESGAENNAGNIYLLFDNNLMNMLNYFDYEKSFARISGTQTWLNRFPQPYGVNEKVYQKFDSRSRFYHFKSLRVFSNLPTSPFYVYNQNTSILKPEQMLTEITINSETFSESQNNILYIPNDFKFNDLQGSQDISNFYVFFEVHYANGSDIRLAFHPGAYISLLLNFRLKDKELKS